MDYKKKSAKREKAISKDIGGKSHPGSGAFWFKKGDASNALILVEDKFTTNTSYSVTLSVLNKLEQQARKECKIPVLSVGFVNKHEEISFAFVEDTYIPKGNYETSCVVLETVKKSKLFTKDDLKSWYANSKTDVIATLNFCGKDDTILRSFLIFKWTTFAEKLNKLCEI